MSFSGITDIDELVQAFINAEDQNFALFNRVNDLGNDIEKIQESTTEILAEIERYKGQGSNTDNQRKQIIQELEVKLDKTDKKTVVYEKKHQQVCKFCQETFTQT